MAKNEENIALSQSLFGSFLFGLKVSLTSRYLGNFSGFTLSWISTLFGSILLGNYVFFIKKIKFPKNLPMKFWVFMFFAGFFKTLSPMFQFLALERISGITMNFVFNFVGIGTMIAGMIINHERPNFTQFIGAMITIFGLIFYFNDLPTTNETIGLLLVLLSIICVAIMNAISRELTLMTKSWNGHKSDTPINSLSVVALSTLIGGIILFVLGILIDWPLKTIPSTSMWLIIYNATFGIVLPSVLWFSLLGKWKAYKASLFSSVSVFWTLLISVIFMGESVAWMQVTGIVIMFIGLWIIHWQVTPTTEEILPTH